MKKNFSGSTKKQNRTIGFTEGKMNAVATFYYVNGDKRAFLRTSQVLRGDAAKKLHSKVLQSDRSLGYSETYTDGRPRKKRTYGK